MTDDHDASAHLPKLEASTPAFTIGTAAELLGVSQGFLRQLGTAGLLDPQRSAGGHRRYSPYDLGLAGQARALVDEGLSMDAACRIVTLHIELAQARAEIAELRRQIRAATRHRRGSSNRRHRDRR